MRRLILRFQISNEMPDLHSGIEGGAIVEPMVDMFVFFVITHVYAKVLTVVLICRVKLLATLNDRNGGIQIPGFCLFF